MWMAVDKPACVAEHLSTLGMVFETIHHIGSVLVWMHCPREIRNYVREQMESAHHTACALWTAEFLSLLIEADLLCEDAEDTQIKLDTLRHITLDGPVRSKRPKPHCQGADQLYPLLEEKCDSHQSAPQFVARHMYLLTEIWNQRILIDSILSEEDDEVAAVSSQASTIDTPKLTPDCNSETTD
ncbi:uncharacterized protein LOC119089920 [Pollicipes pollicipes]|uniref:uncharacterized protein LOC119089920 n=1 Tax=Pollicipes pollicipes TaxID=41117 RepID=UPI0018856723|nr:uncharacterized protein LOC119089920 [Pollicipes pollicipes]